MRKALNENPVMQIAVLGVLAVVVGFMLMTRMSHKTPPPEEPATATTASSTPAPAAGTASTTPAPATGTAPATGVPPATTAPSGEFAAGPGLPGAVVKAYNANKAVVLFVFRHRGIDDAAVRQSVERLRSRADLEVFITHAAHIARYSRITQGVDVDRVPALIVVSPRNTSQGTPTASISYGFRGADSVNQAIRDALYKGPRDLPYYPK